MNPRVVGLDISTRCIGVALPDGRLTSIATGIIEHKDDQPIIPARRSLQMTNRLGSMLRQLPDQPDLAVVEGCIIGGPNIRTTQRLVEVGGCIRMALAALDIPFVEVMPVHLKQWATGKAGADKRDMVAAARSAGAHPANHDQADAYWLRDIGISYYEPWDDLSELQRLILVDRLNFPSLAAAR